MMQDTLGQLYAHILQFLHHALVCYRQNKLMHTVSCIVRPWALTYSEHFEAIKEDSIRFGQIIGHGNKGGAEGHSSRSD